MTPTPASAPESAPVIALVGNPNAGKTAMFNAFTGARQKVGNYPGVTVERHAGKIMMGDGRPAELIDLPGTYSLTPHSPDEAVTRDVLLGRQLGEQKPDIILAVVDAGNLDNHLRFILELKSLGLPMVLALNMVDLARRDGLEIDIAALSEQLGIRVAPTIAVRRHGLDRLRDLLAEVAPAAHVENAADEARKLPPLDIRALQKQARAIADAVTTETDKRRSITRRIDNVALHPVVGPIMLAGILFLMFQAVFAWATGPVEMIESLISALHDAIQNLLPAGFLRDLILEGVIAGVGSVVVFLPQILILFSFILLLEASGYMVRAAFLMDRLMGRAGLSGRAFIPLLSSFACAVPGIMATRTMAEPRDRLTTILIAPLMTCSARLPVYAVIIAAFIPASSVGPGIGLQGLVLFTLYIVGILAAFIVALVLRRTVTKGPDQGFLMEMPKYQMPVLRDFLLGLWQRAEVFLKRAGTIILTSTVILWLLLSYPKPPADADPAIPAVDYSIAANVANGLAVVLKPIGFDRDIALALIPAMAAREVAVSALATVYAIESDGGDEHSLVERLRGKWPLPTALAFLAWFVFAPQCISTIAVVRRETNGWKWPGFLLAYLFALAYVAAGITYWSATAFGL
ncbi:ferrous iron transporter B [Aquisediminimonas sediminicola]|uniref:ferrous iron transporter B n=1 Tax=Alteraquisediminimonas sediminicola TaxID=2676787 RepID=UPI001C8EB71F|nr:ferrous iron transporter B [Aquisediminimonas sediminicola]